MRAAWVTAAATLPVDGSNRIKSGWYSDYTSAREEAKRTGKDVVALVGTHKGEELMTEIREMLKDFQRNETDVYEARSNAATRERIITTSALAILCIFAVGLPRRNGDGAPTKHLRSLLSVPSRRCPATAGRGKRSPPALPPLGLVIIVER